MPEPNQFDDVRLWDPDKVEDIGELRARLNAIEDLCDEADQAALTASDHDVSIPLAMVSVGDVRRLVRGGGRS